MGRFNTLVTTPLHCTVVQCWSKVSDINFISSVTALREGAIDCQKLSKFTSLLQGFLEKKNPKNTKLLPDFGPRKNQGANRFFSREHGE